MNYHVRLEESTLKEDVVVVECLVYGGQYGFGDLLGAVQVMFT